MKKTLLAIIGLAYCADRIQATNDFHLENEAEEFFTLSDGTDPDETWRSI